jgi:hypothetical protein
MGRSQVPVRVAVVFVLLYGGLLALRGPTNPDQIYPASRWELFSRVPERERDSYSIRFVEVDGQVLDEPVYFEKADAFIANPQSPTAYAVLRDLGLSVERGEPLKIAHHKELLETAHMQTIDTARYEVVRRRFDILDRLECDCFLEETVVGELSKGTP